MSAGGRRNEQLARVLIKAAGFSSRVQNMTPAEIAAITAEIRADGNGKLHNNEFGM